MDNEILELAKKTKESIQNLKCNHYFEDVPINQDQLLLICEYIERISKVNEDNTKLIEAFCADDGEWHKLLDTREQENSTLIRLIIKLADKYSEMKKELERINNLKPIVFASEKDISDLKIFTYLFAERQNSESVNIPLYRLDK